MPTLFVVRHAEPALQGVLLGQSDPPLSDEGVRQATELRGKIPELRVYSSPLRRAWETAERVGENPIVLPDLKEITYGLWDGLSWQEIERNWPDLAKRKLENWLGITPPGGEPAERFLARIQRALATVLDGPMPAVIVAHEAVNGAIGQLLRNAAIESYKQNYCEIIKYDV